MNIGDKLEKTYQRLWNEHWFPKMRDDQLQKLRESAQLNALIEIIQNLEDRIKILEDKK